MRLIDADALLQNHNLYKCSKHPDNAQEMYHSTNTLMFYEIRDMIDDAPTVIPEAEEYRASKKVRWEDKKYRSHVPYCPSCLNDITHFASTPYCPFCGQALDWAEVEE